MATESEGNDICLDLFDIGDENDRNDYVSKAINFYSEQIEKSSTIETSRSGLVMDKEILACRLALYYLSVVC
ncbi:hypothetical protein I4U23_025075 [Adineta vaga]|nr:hypothetical protein I4U23_025075 [Adineta vaga]